MKPWCKGLINRNLYDSTGNTKFFLVLRIPVFLFFDLQNQANEGMVKRRCHNSVRISLKIVVASLLPKKISPCFRAPSKREIWWNLGTRPRTSFSACQRVLSSIIYLWRAIPKFRIMHSFTWSSDGDRKDGKIYSISFLSSIPTNFTVASKSSGYWWTTGGTSQHVLSLRLL